MPLVPLTPRIVIQGIMSAPPVSFNLPTIDEANVIDVEGEGTCEGGYGESALPPQLGVVESDDGVEGTAVDEGVDGPGIVEEEVQEEGGDGDDPVEEEVQEEAGDGDDPVEEEGGSSTDSESSLSDTDADTDSSSETDTDASSQRPDFWSEDKDALKVDHGVTAFVRMMIGR